MIHILENRIFLNAAIVAAFAFFVVPFSARAQVPDDLSRLSASVQYGSVEEKRDALYHIRVIGTVETARMALPALSDPSETVRAEAAATCALLPPNEAFRAVGPLLNDKEEFVRSEAAFALGKARAAAAVVDISRLLGNDRKPEVRAAAATALGLIGDESAVGTLTEALGKNKGSKRAFIRREAATAIGRIAEVSRGIEAATSIPESFLPRRFKTTVVDADVKPMADAPPFASASKVLRLVLSSQDELQEVRRAAAFALGAIGDPALRPALTGCSAASELVLAEICREGLGKLAGKD